MKEKIREEIVVNTMLLMLILGTVAILVTGGRLYATAVKICTLNVNAKLVAEDMDHHWTQELQNEADQIWAERLELSESPSFIVRTFNQLNAGLKLLVMVVYTIVITVTCYVWYELARKH